MRTTIILIAAVAALAGCTTPQHRAARLQAEMDNMMVTYGPACARLGYADKSNEWRDCVLKLSSRDYINTYGIAPYYYPSGFDRSHWGVGGLWGPSW